MAYDSTPYPSDATAGTEVSGTQHGITIMIQESLLTHPTHSDGLVNKGDPVKVTSGSIYGIALESAAASTDLIAVAVSGIFNLSVVEGETANHIRGEKVYFVDASGVINTSASSATLFGYLLNTLASGVTGVRPVLLAGLGR